MLTREEGVWLAPSLAVVVGGAAIQAAGRTAPVERRQALARLAGCLVAGIAVGGGIIAGVAAANRAHYGAFETNEVLSAPFARAYGAIARITPDRPRDQVVFPRDARMRAYAASPAARELAASFEGDGGESWRYIGCTQMLQTDCPDILSGWFQWALRTAVAHAGHYRSAADSTAFYDRLAREINAACDAGELPCGPPRTTLAPPLRWANVVEAGHRIPAMAGLFGRLGAESVANGRSIGRLLQSAEFADMVGPLAPGAPRWLVRGLAAAAFGPAVTLRTRDGTAATFSIDTYSTPPGDWAPPGLMTIAFEMETACPPESCEIAVGGDGAGLLAGRLDAPTPQRLQAPGLVLRVGSVEPTLLDGAARNRRAVLARLMRSIARAYAAIMPAGAALACLGLAVTVLRIRRRPPSVLLLTLALASAAAVGARVALLAYLDVVAIPSINTLYASPATPFALLFVILGCSLGVEAFRRRGQAGPGLR